MAVSFNQRGSDYRILNALVSPSKTAHIVKERKIKDAVSKSIPMIDEFIESGMICAVYRKSVKLLCFLLIES